MYTLQHCASSAPVLQCHVTHDLPNSVSLVVLHVCVGVESGRDADPPWQTSPRAGPSISSCPISPQACASGNGEARMQPSSTTRRFAVGTSRKNFHLTTHRQMWFGMSPFSQSDIPLPTVGAEGRP